MTDPRAALTPQQIAQLWTQIDMDSAATRAEYIGVGARVPGASRLTLACMHTATAVMLDTGLRPVEMVNLEWVDVGGLDGDRAWITITADHSKSHRARQISATARLTRRLALHRQLQIRNPTLKTDRVLHAYPAQKHPLSTRTLQRWVAWITGETLGRAVRPYDLRHTYATQLVQVADLETVRNALGHRHINTTQVYLHTQPQRHRSAVAEFEATTNGA